MNSLYFVNIAISVLKGNPLHLSQMKHVRVKCFAKRHNNEKMSHCPNIERGETWYMSENLQQAGLETARQAATLAKLHALTIASRPSLIQKYFSVVRDKARLEPIDTSSMMWNSGLLLWNYFF